MNEEVRDKLSEVLDVEYVESKPKDSSSIIKRIDAPLVSKENMEKDLSSDYREVRGNLKDLISQGQDAIDGIISVATDSDSPRAYEVAGQMIKTVADMNKDLIDLHKQMKELKKEEVNINHNTHNSIYVGSTSDLQDLINQSRSAKKALTNNPIIDVEEVSGDDK